MCVCVCFSNVVVVVVVVNLFLIHTVPLGQRGRKNVSAVEKKTKSQSKSKSCLFVSFSFVEMQTNDTDDAHDDDTFNTLARDTQSERKRTNRSFLSAKEMFR